MRFILERMVQQGKVPTGLLFSGSRGCGKTTSGRILAAALNCQEPNPPCVECASCQAIYAGNSFDVQEIDAASHGNVADIRDLSEKLLYSVGGGTRLILLDEAHSLSREAFNALLKTLEEPPPETVFVLLTTEPGKILETVLSRLMNFEFRRITISDIVERLQHIVAAEGIGVEDELLLTIAERANGGMRDAVMTLDQVTRVGVKTSVEFAELLGESDFGPELVKVMLTGDTAKVFLALDAQLIRTGDATTIVNQLVGTLRDVVVLHSGGPIPRQGASLQARQEIMSLVQSQQLLNGMKMLWELKTKVRSGEDPRVVLDLAAVMVTEQLSGSLTPQQTKPVARRKLTLAEMRATSL